MAERNHLTNGRFWHDIDDWTASGATYSAGGGDDHYGNAVLSTGGDYIEQTFSVPAFRAYTLHISVYAVGANLTAGQATVSITDGDGNAVVTQNLSGVSNTWTENNFTLGLAPGTTYTLRITNASATGNVQIDDVWLWFVPTKRSDLAEQIHRKLGRVATDRSYQTLGSGAQTEGDYTDAIDEGLRAVGAINDETGQPDTRYLDEQGVKGTVDAALQAMLERAAIDYSVEVDITLGPHTERLSQKRGAVEKLAGLDGEGGAGVSRQVISRKLHHPRADYEWKQ